MKLAITEWNGRVSPVFDSSAKFEIYMSKDCISIEKEILSVKDMDLYEKILLLKDKGVDELICGAISVKGAKLLESYGIKLYSFISGDVLEVFQAWINQSVHLPKYMMPGCRFDGTRMRKKRRHGRRSGFGNQ